MKPTIRILIYCLAAASAAALTSCSNHDNVVGTWSGMPTSIDNIPQSTDATMQLSVSFAANEQNGSGLNGRVSLSALIDANRPISANGAYSPANQSEVSIAATATISGLWTYEDHDDDDILINLDPQTLQVNVDPNGVTFSTDILTSMQQPALDSLTAATVYEWERTLKQAVRNEFYKFQKVSDVKIRNGIMSCEINDRDYTFRKTGN